MRTLTLRELQQELANQRRAVRELFEACDSQGHPEYFAQVALEPLVEINVVRAIIDQLTHPGRHWDGGGRD
jgi:hypothetical protein